MLPRDSADVPPPSTDTCDPHVATQLDRLRVRHALIVTDEPSAQRGCLELLSAALPERFELTLFEPSGPDPTEPVALDAAELYRLLGCDGIIAIGGAPARMLASLVAALVAVGAPLARFVTPDGERLTIRASVPPLVRVTDPSQPIEDSEFDGRIALADGRRLQFDPPLAEVHATLAAEPASVPRR